MHIVFNVSEDYLKYTAIAIYSILVNAKRDDFGNFINTDKFFFHFLTDGVSEDSVEKLDSFFSSVGTMYPCEYSIYFVDEKEFANFSKTGAARKNYTTYYRIKMLSYLPSDIDFCLYIDSDVLVCDDVSELLNINMSNFIAAVVLDWNYMNTIKLTRKKDKKKINIKLPHCYFNAGVMYVNTKEWKKNNIESQCMNILTKYDLEWADQDALNLAIRDKTVKLQPKWNFLNFINTSNFPLKTNSFNEFSMPFSHEELESSLQDLKIIHLHSPKPWGKFVEYSSGEILINKVDKYILKWWNYAKEIPIYKDDLLKLHQKQFVIFDDIELIVERNDLINEFINSRPYLIGYTFVNTKKIMEIVKLPYKILFIFLKTNKYYDERFDQEEYVEISAMKKHLSFQIGKAFLENPITFIFRISKIYKNFKSLR
ncbi:glycosyltransferase family 8 protein [Campylobacter jejuni]|nr:glycosyltransferase family 8 protein [Campylobacter jejuni]